MGLKGVGLKGVVWRKGGLSTHRFACFASLRLLRFALLAFRGGRFFFFFSFLSLSLSLSLCVSSLSRCCCCCVGLKGVVWG